MLTEADGSRSCAQVAKGALRAISCLAYVQFGKELHTEGARFLLPHSEQPSQGRAGLTPVLGSCSVEGPKRGAGPTPVPAGATAAG